MWACSVTATPRWLSLSISFPLFPSLVRSPSTSKPTESVWGEIVPDLEMAARFLSNLGFNKGKQITKMEIFKLVFSGIQIDVWVARRHRPPHSCYLVIKMIQKIPPCFGFHLLKQSVSFPRRISPFSVQWQPPDHSRIANIWICLCWNLASDDFCKELNFKNTCAFQSGEIQIKKLLGTLPGSAVFCVRGYEFYDSA